MSNLGMILHAMGMALLLQTPPLPPLPPAATQGAGQPQQLPGRDQAQRPPMVGKSSLSGTVVGDTGRPLKGARVSLSGVAMGRTATTDATGGFVFDKLPEGRYTLSASRQRYLSGGYGQKKPERSGVAVQLADGEQRKDLTITLFSAGVITGTVFGDDGEPVQNAQVRALRYTMRSGVKRLQSSGGAQTDDRGVYRLYGLNPGDYIVSATSNQQDLNVSINAEMAVAMERAAVAGTPISISNGVVSLGGETIEPPASTAFAPTYYPGSTLPNGATTVTVRGGEERGGVDVALQRVQTATVSGTVVSAAGGPLQNVNLQMQANDEAGQGIPLPSARVGADGRFSMRGVPPGQYTITARSTTQTRTEVPAAGGVTQVIQTQQLTSTGRAAVSVDGQSVSGVVITLDGGRSVSGRVSFVGGVPPDMTKVRTTATLQPAPTASALNLTPPSPAVVGVDGTFKIAGVAPGRYTLRVSGMQGWTVRSSVIGGIDSLDFPFDVDAEDIVGAVVTMAPPAPSAELSGTVTDQLSKPVSDYTIVAFSTDQRYWTPGSRRILTTRPGTDGRYVIRGLPPGDYQLAALEDLEPGTQFDTELLKQLLVASTRVTVGEGAKAVQDLRVTSQSLAATASQQSRTSSPR